MLCLCGLVAGVFQCCRGICRRRRLSALPWDFFHCSCPAMLESRRNMEAAAGAGGSPWLRGGLHPRQRKIEMLRLGSSWQKWWNWRPLLLHGDSRLQLAVRNELDTSSGSRFSVLQDVSEEVDHLDTSILEPASKPWCGPGPLPAPRCSLPRTIGGVIKAAIQVEKTGVGEMEGGVR